MKKIKLLHIYMFKEILMPFLFGFVAFSVIIAGGGILPGIVNEANQMNLAFDKMLLFFMLRIPGILSWIFPMATLLAALLCFSRLSGDSELAAFKAGGISLYKLIISPLIFGVLISLVTIFINETVVPKASFMEENLKIQLKDLSKSMVSVEEQIYTPIKDRSGQLVRSLYAEKKVGDLLQGVYFLEYTDRRLVRNTTAKTATYDPLGGWTFHDGVMHQFAGDNRSALLVDFVTHNINFNIDIRDVSGRTREAEQMDIFALGKYIDQQVSMGSNVFQLRVRWQQKLAVPFACFVFVLLGSTMGIRPQRSSSSVGLGVSVLVIFFYYVLLTFFGMLSFLSPYLAAWLPNILVGAYGFYGLYQKGNV